MILRYLFFLLFTISTANAFDVAIVGAGASGLTAAHYLKKMGHQVTIFEKENRVGGKVESFNYNGTTVELGGILVTRRFAAINELVNQYGPGPQLCPTKFLFLNKNNHWQKFKGYSALGPFGTLIQYKKLLSMYRRFPELNTPHLVSGIHPDLFLSLNDFSKKYGFLEVLPPFVMSLTGSGYLFPEVIPAYYAMKLFRVIAGIGLQGYLENILPVSSPYVHGLYCFKNGYSRLWENIAKHFDVRLNEEVLKVSDGKIITTKGEYQFNRVIISSNLKSAAKIISPVSNSVNVLVDNLKQSRFIVSLIRTSDLPHYDHHSFFFYPNMTQFRINHVLSLVNYWGDSSLYLAYQTLDKNISWEESRKILEEDLKSTLSVKQVDYVKQVEWSYFDHLSVGGLTSPVRKALAEIQGQDGIYFVGESLNFESTESAAENAKWVVEHL